MKQYVVIFSNPLATEAVGPLSLEEANALKAKYSGDDFDDSMVLELQSAKDTPL